MGGTTKKIYSEEALLMLLAQLENNPIIRNMSHSDTFVNWKTKEQ